MTITEPLHAVLTRRSRACPATVDPGTVVGPVHRAAAPRQVHHPLGCHRQRIPDRVIFDKLIQILIFGCGYRRIADATCSATTLRRRDEWIALGLAERLRLAVRDPTSGCSAWNWSTWPWTGASPKRPAAARPPAPARWTIASKG